MATWYTDNLTGNDTTGDGTIGNPYKSVLKAIQVGTAGDTINVAGSGWTDLPGTLTATVGASTMTTSQDLTAVAPVGTVFALKDPVVGNRTFLYRVTAINATTITLNTPSLDTGTFSAEKITTNHYVATVANTDLENLSAITSAKNNFNIQGGWTNSFTAQDGITVFVNTSATVQSGTAFRGVNSNWLNGITLNNFAFVSLASAGPVLFGVGQGTTVYLGNIWFSFCGFVSNNTEIFDATTGCNLSWNRYDLASISFNSAFSFPQNKVLTINNFYYGNMSNGSTISSTNTSVKINNFWIKNRNLQRSQHIFTAGVYEIGNLYSQWTQTGTTSFDNGFIVLFSASTFNCILRSYIESGFTSLYKSFSLGSGINNQIIAPTENVNNWRLGIYASGFNNRTWNYAMVYDIEGQKQLFESATTLFADPTVYDTGTNSLRISRTIEGYSTFSSIVQPPIKNVYIPVGSSSPITFTVRAKSTGSMNMTLGIQQVASATPNGGTDGKGELFYRQNFGITNAWGDSTYTLTGPQVASLAGSYIKLCIVVNYGQWAQPYLWIDSITQS